MNATASIQSALDHCRDICRRRARNFYYGLKLSPEPQRSALFAIYAWMRLADDLVDNDTPPDSSNVLERIRQFRAATDAALGGAPIDDDPVWTALSATARRFNLPADHFHAMLDGQLDDAQRRSYETFEQLRPYCHRVASTVGLLCIEIWGYENGAARDLAIERGIGFQLTNILRDFKQDHDAARIYLPQEDFRRHRIEPGDVRRWNGPDRCEKFLREQIERTASFYERSAALESLILPACRPTLWAMTSIYRGLLDKMAANPSRIVLDKRVRLSTIQKTSIALRAKWVMHKVVSPAPLSAPAVTVNGRSNGRIST